MKSINNIKDISGIGPLSRKLKAWVVDQPRGTKRTIVIGIDLVCLLLVIAGCIYTRIQVGSDFVAPDTTTFILLFALPFISIGSFFYLGLYRLVTRHVGRKGLWRIGYSLLASIMVWALLVFLADYRGVLLILPRSVLVSYLALGWLVIWINRQVARWWLRDRPLEESLPDDSSVSNVMIYGAGEAGLSLLRTLNESRRYNVIGFFDDDVSLWSMKMDGHKIHRFDQIDKLIAKEGVSEVFIAIPSLSRLHKRSIIRKLEPYPVKVRILPKLTDIATGRIKINDLRVIEINDLLGRDPVPPIQELMHRNITGKSVMVTGAGGSIGSEISRQVLHNNPEKLILLELSELALYNIREELAELVNINKQDGAISTAPEIIAVLGSAGDEGLTRELVCEHKIHTVYHTAAYKHIPLLEENPFSAIENNVFATINLARVMQEQGVANMVLISSDKAVRPSNIKGASNRLQEMVLQALADDKDGVTNFSIVRFGNVLDSSGSVVPKFREQIKKGGPVTVTHHEIVRYFMSIKEAAQLVIQAGAMARGGEIYVLDMGEPVKIDDLARTMIRLSGKEVRDEHNPGGDIELKYIGLRPGDKMYEELLIEGNVIGSRHPYIMRLSEPYCLGMKELTMALADLGQAMKQADMEQLQKVLRQLVEGYQEESVLRVVHKKSEQSIEEFKSEKSSLLH